MYNYGRCFLLFEILERFGDGRGGRRKSSRAVLRTPYGETLVPRAQERRGENIIYHEEKEGARR
jgi:hypothetical protein